jgi:hypothetical protein
LNTYNTNAHSEESQGCHVYLHRSNEADVTDLEETNNVLLPIFQGQSLYYQGKNSSRSSFRSLANGNQYAKPLNLLYFLQMLQKF